MRNLFPKKKLQILTSLLLTAPVISMAYTFVIPTNDIGGSSTINQSDTTNNNQSTNEDILNFVNSQCVMVDTLGTVKGSPTLDGTEFVDFTEYDAFPADAVACQIADATTVPDQLGKSVPNIQVIIGTNANPISADFLSESTTVGGIAFQGPSGGVDSNLSGLSGITVDSTVANLMLGTSFIFRSLSGVTTFPDINLSGLSSSVDFVISDMANLQTIAGLSNVPNQLNSVDINQNPLLSDISPLIGLTSIATFVDVIGNSALNDISPLQNIASGDVRVDNREYQTKMPDTSPFCLKSITRSGDVTINGNLAEEDIANVCDVDLLTLDQLASALIGGAQGVDYSVDTAAQTITQLTSTPIRDINSWCGAQGLGASNATVDECDFSFVDEPLLMKPWPPSFARLRLCTPGTLQTTNVPPIEIEAGDPS